MLKPYDFQEEAIQKLEPHRSVLNADDMGLGKTIQAIELDKRRRLRHNCTWTAQTLVVCPFSMTGTWKKELAKWAPDMRVFVYEAKNRAGFFEALAAKDSKGHPRYHVFVLHWKALSRPEFVKAQLKAANWFHIIGDEIQNIKNRKAQMTRTFKSLPAYYKAGFSGTWADNKPQDAWSILNWLWPGVYRSYNTFEYNHIMFKSHNTGTCMANDCGKFHRTAFKEVTGVADVHVIHNHISPFYVRRTKLEVLKDLPEKYYTQIDVDLTPQQRRAYNQMAEQMLAWVGKNETEPIAAPVVIAKLVRLQQFGCAYGSVEDVAKKVKDKETGEIRLVRRRILRLTEPSSKLDAAMELIGDTDGQVVVFGQSKQVINLLGERLTKEGIPHGLLTGDTKMADRNSLLEDFQSGRRRVFAGTISAGGVGITLTAASTVIFLDRAWSPSQNKQAEDRLHRIGQKNAVHVIDLVARDTVDNGRLQQIALKWSWLKQILEVKK